jgi:hypothetical protein
MEARVDGLGHILRDRLLAVPPYQRSYSWDKDEVQQYISDLQAAQGALEPTYFMGTVLLTPSKQGRLIVIDGQQRLATTVLLFAAISAELAEAGEGSRASIVESQYVASRALDTNELQPRLVLNIEDAEFFEGLTLRKDGQDPERQSHRRMASAYRQLRVAVREEVERAGSHWQDALFRWVSFLDSQVQVIAVVADNEADAFLLFETLNDRGMDLTVVDLLKNHLFGLARNTLERVQRPWLGAIETLDSEEDQTLTTFVRHYWSSVNGVTRERELYRALRQYIRSEEQAAEFAEDLQAAAYHYAALLDPDHEYWAGLSAETGHAASILLSFGLEQNRPLLMAAMEVFDEAELGRLLESLVSWTVRGLIVGGLGAGTTEASYSNAAQQIRRGSLSNTAEVLEAIRQVVPEDAEFSATFETTAVYRIKTGAYLLLAIERYMGGNERPAFPTPSERAEYLAEALLPRNADPADWPGWTIQEISAFSRRLGNFALIQAGQRLSGRAWPDRRALLNASGLATNAKPADAERWRPALVVERQREFAERAPRIWPIFP